MEEQLARMVARLNKHEAWWKLYLPGVRRYIHQGEGIPMTPQMSIWPSVIDNTIEIRIKVTQEWMVAASEGEKLSAMLFFADAWGAAIGLKS